MGTVFYSLKVFFRSLYQTEKNLNKIQKGSQVVLLMPYSQTSLQANSSSDKASFKVNMPDVKFLVATNGAKDGFSSIVDNVQTDAFTIRAPTQNDPSAIEQIKAVATAIQSGKIHAEFCEYFFYFEISSCTSFFADVCLLLGRSFGHGCLKWRHSFRIHQILQVASELFPQVDGNSENFGR